MDQDSSAAVVEVMEAEENVENTTSASHGAAPTVVDIPVAADTNSSSDDTPRMVQPRAKEAWQYFRDIEDRIRFLEEKVRVLEGGEPVDASAPRPTSQPLLVRKPVVPELNAVRSPLHEYISTRQHTTYAVDIFSHQTSSSRPSNISRSEEDGSDLDPAFIRINSPSVLSALEEIAAPHFSAQRPIIVHPFKVLVLYEKPIREYLNSMVDTGGHAEALAEFKCLIHFIDRHLALSVREKIFDGKIAFQDLWQLFRSEKLVVRRETSPDNSRDIFQIISTQGGSNPQLWQEFEAFHHLYGKGDGGKVKLSENAQSIMIDCCSYDFDGLKFVPVRTRFQIRSYEGLRQITSLPVYPSTFHPDESALIKYNERRGKRFVSLTHVSHQNYYGLTLDDFPIQLDSQIVVDLQMAYHLNPGLAPTKDSAKDWGSFESVGTKEGCGSWGCAFCDRIDDDRLYDIQSGQEYILRTSPPLNQPLDAEQLHDLACVLLPNFVIGYALKIRKWSRLRIDLLDEIERLNILDDLVLPAGHKNILVAMVSASCRPPKTGLHNPEDYKGRSLFILLHGAPGVGKRTTVRGIADMTARPFMEITCGDLGQDAVSLEYNLEQVFSLASKWKAIVLLSEADIFLATRDRTNMQRNAMVSVLLRLMQYFQGVLFFSTDRVGTFDDAFKSVIHVSLYYPALSQTSSLKIWKFNMQRVARGGEVTFKERDIIQFAKNGYESGELRWNGLQIRNAFDTAIALAENAHGKYDSSGEKSMLRVTVEHFQEIARTYQQFDSYLSTVYGNFDSPGMMVRSDDFHSKTRAAPVKRKDQPGPAERRRTFESSDEPSDSDSEISDLDKRDSPFTRSQNITGSRDAPRRGPKEKEPAIVNPPAVDPQQIQAMMKLLSDMLQSTSGAARTGSEPDSDIRRGKKFGGSKSSD